MKKIRIAIISQNDSFVIPRNIMMLHEKNFIEIKAIISVVDKGSLASHKWLFVRGFGLFQCFRMLWISLNNWAVNFFDIFTLGAVIVMPKSLSAAAMRCGAMWINEANPNSDKLITTLEEMKLDLIISFSAPCVFRPKLLAVPKMGCINLHCSLLPKYAGILPSFWSLYNGERKTGVTIHYMDTKIDNGLILAQVEVPIPQGASMFEVIKTTKRVGGELMCRVIESLNLGLLEASENDVGKGSYFTWPTVAQIIDFRKKGGKLI